MDQAVSDQPLTVGAWVQSQDSSCRICGRLSW